MVDGLTLSCESKTSKKQVISNDIKNDIEQLFTICASNAISVALLGEYPDFPNSISGNDLDVSILAR